MVDLQVRSFIKLMKDKATVIMVIIIFRTNIILFFWLAEEYSDPNRLSNLRADGTDCFGGYKTQRSPLGNAFPLQLTINS